MYYIKIPLAHLVTPEQLNVAPDKQQELWDARVAGLLQDIRAGVIPSWAVSFKELESVTVEEE